MSTMEVLNGVYATEGETQFVVCQVSDGTIGVFGIFPTKSDASVAVKKVGEHELALLKKQTDENRTKISTDSDESSYTIETQWLGTFRNGYPVVFCKVYYEEVSMMKNVTKKFEDELAAHPLAFKDNE